MEITAFALGTAEFSYYVYWEYKYNSAVDNFNHENDLYRANPKDFLKKTTSDSKNRVDSSRKNYNVALVIWGVIYLSNIVEAYINRPVLYDYNIAISPALQKTDRGMACSMEIRVGF